MSIYFWSLQPSFAEVQILFYGVSISQEKQKKMINDSTFYIILKRSASGYFTHTHTHTHSDREKERERERETERVRETD